MLFRKKIDRACSYCRHGVPLCDGQVLCVKKGIKKPERDELTPAIIREYLKALILNCMQMYMDTQNIDYACTLKTLLKLFYVSEFDGNAKRSQSAEAELIMDIVMPELYEERPPAEIAEMAVRLLPEIRP